MRVDGGSNCHDFWYNHLFYLLFVRPTSVHVSGGSIFLAAGVGVVHVKLPGFHTLHSLDPAYWTPIYCTNTFSISALNSYSEFLRPPMKLSHLSPSASPKATILSLQKLAQTTLTINIRVSKKDQSRPTGPHLLISPSIIIPIHSL